MAKRDLPINFADNGKRPQFERMIADLQRAKRQWDFPLLRGYATVLLYQTGAIAISESVENSKVEIKRWPVPEAVIEDERIKAEIEQIKMACL